MRPRTSIRCSLMMAPVMLLPLGARVADAQPPHQHPAIAIMLRVNEQALSGRPAMVSAIRDGRIVEQQEMPLTTSRQFDAESIQPGVYDVRVEGEGLITEVKRGIHVFADQKTELTFDVRPGKGVHIVEYATGGLSREEVAARLAKLEAQVAELSKPRPQK